jgi:hypothetical protein
MIEMNGSIARWCAPITDRAATTKQRFALIAFRSQSFTEACKSCRRSAIFVAACTVPCDDASVFEIRMQTKRRTFSQETV